LFAGNIYKVKRKCISYHLLSNLYVKKCNPVDGKLKMLEFI